ncbi:MAG: hypothetical protein U9Q71_02665 [Pseudomonadota bacterium]|nr:hypothetical protein [Pseudomonadota bacterium]
MRKFVTSAITAALLAGIAATATAEGDASAAIAQAEQALAMAKEKDGIWMALDKSTGKKAVNLPKLLDAAKKAQQDGNAAEAARIAEKVSAFAELGIAQADSQPDAAPFYLQ